jgi:hypothetical protein
MGATSFAKVGLACGVELSTSVASRPTGLDGPLASFVLFSPAPATPQRDSAINSAIQIIRDLWNVCILFLPLITTADSAKFVSKMGALKSADYSNIVVLTKLVCDPKYTLNQRRYYIIGRSKGL